MLHAVRRGAICLFLRFVRTSVVDKLRFHAFLFLTRSWNLIIIPRIMRFSTTTHRYSPIRSCFTKFGIISILFAGLCCCKMDEIEGLINSGVIKKSITTKTYIADNEFDQLVPGEPAYDLEYDQTMQMDYKWSTIYYDINNNPLAKESLFVNDQGDLVTGATYFYDYPFPSDSSVVDSTMISSSGSRKMIFIIDDGVIMGTETYNNNRLISKEIFQYNESGQRIKTEIYEEEGLEIIIDYKYDTNVVAQGRVIEKKIEYLKPFRFSENYYYTYLSEKLIKSQKYVVRNEKRLSEVLKNYTYFDSGLIYTIISREPRSIILDEKADDGNKYLTKVLTFNGYGDCIRCTLTPDGYQVANKPKDGEDMSKYYNHLMLNTIAFPDAAEIECEYEYNNQGEWTKAVLTVSPFPPSNKYLISRDITYY